ncbi:MAG: substrate-binding periplasmic protein [Neptuniibacter sp.]
MASAVQPLRTVALALLITLSVVSSQRAVAELTFYSENYPPFNYQENSVNKGIAIDLLELIFEELGAPYDKQDILFTPWPRALAITKSTPGSVLFSTFRTSAREDYFKWVGPIASTHNALIGHMSVLFPVHKAVDLEGFRIGVIKADIAAVQLQQLNIPNTNLTSLPYPEMAAKMLEKGRIDLWAYDFNVANAIQKQLGIPTEQYEVAYYLGKPGQLYYAFNPETDDQIVSNFQKALDRVKTKQDEEGNNLYQKLLERYDYQEPDLCYGISGECWNP